MTLHAFKTIHNVDIYKRVILFHFSVSTVGKLSPLMLLMTVMCGEPITGIDQ